MSTQPNRELREYTQMKTKIRENSRYSWLIQYFNVNPFQLSQYQDAQFSKLYRYLLFL